MIRDLKSKKEVNLLIVVFIIIGMLGIAVKYFEFYHIEIMGTTTADIYEHPLKVSNAALNIQLDVYKIHRDMKDIVLSLSNQELLAFTEKVNQHELRVYENLKIIEHNICCNDGLTLHKKAKELFDAWKPIRDEVIALVKNAKKDDAIAITKGKGAEHVLKLEAAAFDLNAYAQDKAIGFKNESESSFKILKTINTSINLLFFLLFISIGYYIIHRIFKFISKNEHLNGILSVIRDVNQLIIREKNPLALIQESCSILTSTHIYSNAWIVTYDENSKIEYIAGTYPAENLMLFKEKLPTGWVPHCMNKTVDGNNLYSFVENTKNSCTECPLKDEYKNKSAFNIALKHHDKLYGYLTLSIDTKYLGDKDELALLDEIAGDIAYALYKLKIEQQFKTQEERYRYAIEGTTDGLWDWNLLSKSLYFSPRWKEILGYSDEELENSFTAWKERLHPDDIAQVLSDIQAAQKSESGHYKNIHRLKHKDGHWVWIEARAQVIFDEHNQPIRMIGSHIDITHKKESEDKIAYLKDLYDNVIDSIDNLIFVKDVNLVYIACNKAFEKFIGKPKDQIIGKTDYDIVDKELAEFFREHDQIILLKNLSTSNFEWVTYPDGHQVYLFTLKSPLIDARGEVLGLVGNSADLTERQHLFGLLQDAQSLAKLGSFEYDLLQDKFTCSDEIFKIYGFTDFKMKLDKETFVKRQHPDDIKKAEEDFQNSLNSHEITIAQNRILRYDNKEIRHLEHRWITEFNIDGKAVKTIGTTQDISEQKEIEQALFLETKRYEITEKIGRVGSWEYNISTQGIWGSSEAKQIFGLPESSNLFTIETIEGCIPDRKRVHQALVDLLEKGVEYNLEFEIHPFDGGSAKIISSIAKIEYYENKKPKKVSGFIQDVTIKFELDKELQSSHDMLRKLTKNVPGAIYQYRLFPDGHASFPYASNGIAEIYEVEPKDVAEDAQPVFEIIHPDDFNMIATSIQNSAQSMNDWNLQYRVNLPKKGVRWLEGNAKPEKLEDGSTLWHGYIHDITELKRREELMIIQSRHAAMGEMIGMIAHQWRQPLTVISMNANNMILDIALDDLDAPHIKEYSNEILMQTQHLSKTIDDFRNFFKPDKSLLKIKVQEVLEETYIIVKDTLLNHNITLNTSYASESEINAYPRELMQVFVNIINNAKDALILQNSENAQINVKVFEDEKYVITEICDNGGGIDEAILPKIFDPYFTTKDEKTGTGLGLYMSKMIIDDHLRGKIEAFNLNTGACFRVMLRK